MKKTFKVLFIGLVLGGLIVIQKYLNENSLFKYYPYAGELLHLTAGICVSVILSIFSDIFFEQLPPKRRALFIMLGVLIVELFWELLEVLLGWNNRQVLYDYLNNTIEDVVVTVIGGLLGIVFFVKK